MRKLIDRYQVWRAVRRELKHRKWLRSSKVMYLGTPHHSTRRGGTEAVP